MSTRRPILVSGSPRSGTTWVGKMIAASSSIGYIHEPFNPLHHPGTYGVTFPQWFMYVSEENETPFYKPLKSTLEFHYAVNAELLSIRSAREIKRIGGDWSTFTINRLLRKTPLMKDPIAIFSCDWLAKTFDMNVIVMIRHPAAFVSSVKRLNWEHDFNGFLQQPQLMRDHLSSFASEIEKFATYQQDILDRAVLLWRIMHHTILKYQQNHDNWIFLRHEDISADPMHHFTYLFKQLDIEFTNKVRGKIEEYTSTSNPIKSNAADFDVKRNSIANIKSWSKKLTPAEITYIRNKVEDISSSFYKDSDW